MTASANRSTRVPVLYTVTRTRAWPPGSTAASAMSSSRRIPACPEDWGMNDVWGCRVSGRGRSVGCSPGCRGSPGCGPADQERYAPQPGFEQNWAPGGLVVPQLAQFIAAPR
ncbi:hypothetical protein GCM10023194_36220 [Planotetraspora phitsanulokensis]